MTDLEAAKRIAVYAEILAGKSIKRSAHGLLMDAESLIGSIDDSIKYSEADPICSGILSSNKLG